jgi:hypothetical protein
MWAQITCIFDQPHLSFGTLEKSLKFSEPQYSTTYLSGLVVELNKRIQVRVPTYLVLPGRVQAYDSGSHLIFNKVLFPSQKSSSVYQILLPTKSANPCVCVSLAEFPKAMPHFSVLLLVKTLLNKLCGKCQMLLHGFCCCCVLFSVQNYVGEGGLISKTCLYFSE